MFKQLGIVFAYSLACIANGAQADTPPKVAGLVKPESVVAGADGRIYVSEIGGFGTDGDGRISVIGADGKARTYAAGMNDPKGLAFFGNTLYVADKTRVLAVGIDGKWSVHADAQAFPAPPQFLNDVETDAAGNVYVSDSGDLKGQGGAIYRIGRNGKVATIVDGKTDARVLAPNGLLMDGNAQLLTVDFVSGELYRIPLRGGEMQKLAEGFGGGDGIARGEAGTLYVSDWKNGKVYVVNKQGAVKLLRDGFQAAADIALSADRRFILVPDMNAGELVWLTVP